MIVALQLSCIYTYIRTYNICMYLCLNTHTHICIYIYKIVFSTIIAIIICACACWALFVVTLTNTVYLIYIYIYIYIYIGPKFSHNCADAVLVLGHQQEQWWLKIRHVLFQVSLDFKMTLWWPWRHKTWPARSRGSLSVKCVGWRTKSISLVPIATQNLANDIAKAHLHRNHGCYVFLPYYLGDKLSSLWTSKDTCVIESGVLCNLGYRPETHLKLKSRKISFVHSIRYICPIVSKFRTEHGSVARQRALCKISKRLDDW